MITSVLMEFTQIGKPVSFNEVKIAYCKLKEHILNLKINEFGELSQFSRANTQDFYDIRIWVCNNLKMEHVYYELLQDHMSELISETLPKPELYLRFFEQ